MANTSHPYKSYHVGNFRSMPQFNRLSNDQTEAIEIVSQVLPFKVNNYVLDELIDWDAIPDDPIFRLTIPQRDMLSATDYESIKFCLHTKDTKRLSEEVLRIRLSMNPHPAKQLEMNTPSIDGVKIMGMQHKYTNTVLFFPSQGQTCHAYCTFCFRWPQFTGMQALKISSNEPQLLVDYLKQHTEVTDIIFTGGDPMMMKASVLAKYIDPILEADLSHVNAIRIGTKAFAYWPHRFLTDDDSDELFELFSRIKKRKKHLALMAHFSHPKELAPYAVRKALTKVVKAGIQIRTQSPLIKGINDHANIWADMWTRQINLGCIPYYMFISRDTGNRDYFAVPLVQAWAIFKEALQQVSGICRTVRGPIMSCTPGKIEIIGIGQVGSQKLITLRMIQGRNDKWALQPFFAEYNEDAVWIDELKPAFGQDHFFYDADIPVDLSTFTSDH